MSLIDIAGLALAALQVTVALVGAYRGKVKDGNLRELDHLLKTRTTIFLNSLRDLLAPVVPKAQLNALLKDPTNPLWHDGSINQKLSKHLGDDAVILFETASKIRETVDKLQKELPPLAQGEPSRNVLRKLRYAVKVFRTGPAHRANITGLTKLTDDFRTIVEQETRYAPRRSISPDELATLRLVQQHASSLYEAVCQGWQCGCGRTHLARMQLNAWCIEPTSALDGYTPRFRFMFPWPASADESAPAWRFAEIAALPNAARSDGEAQADATAGVRSSRSESMSQGFTEPLSVPLQALFPPPTTADTSGSDRRSHDLPPVDTSVTKDQAELPADHELPEATAKAGLCRIAALFDAADDGQCLGYLSNGSEQFGIYKPSDQSPTMDGNDISMPLSELHGQIDEDSREARRGDHIRGQVTIWKVLTVPERVSLARMLSWSVLQLQTTNWFDHHWDSSHIYLLAESAGTLLSYVTHEFQPDDQCYGLTLTKSQKARLTHFAPNEELFTLGIILIELCCGQTIADLAIEEDNGSEFMTAMRVSQRLEPVFGKQYEYAVRGCIGTMGPGVPRPTNLEDEVFQAWVYENIVVPLEKAAEWYIRDV